jgi:N-acetylmuramoyl-L-alanine amidase
MRKIAIAAGHHVGAMGCKANGLIEHEEALKVRDHLWRILRERGHEVTILVGPLATKIECANKFQPDAAVEIHFNAGPPSAMGSECLFGSNVQDTILAENIQKRLVERLETVDRGIKFADYAGTPERDECGFTREIEAPSCIVEPMFLTNVHEAMDLATLPETHRAIAEAVADGIEDFLAERQISMVS